MLGVSIVLCTLVGASKVHANAKGLVYLRGEWPLTNF